MRRLEEYVSAGGRLLRCGYTTGTCAAAAAYAATELLLSHASPACVVVSTPAGIDVAVDVEDAWRDEAGASCEVVKDAGEDPDVTDGVVVRATVSFADAPGIVVEGGRGVGRVTRPGLDQPVGAAAINTVPRAMIEQAARSAASAHGHDGGLSVVVSIPAGEELAKRTFNPRLGIEGGLSVLGTTGIVRPMSEAALVESIRLELRVLRASGATRALVVPGNYGRSFAAERLGLSVEHAVTCSNYLGETIDEAARLGFSELLVVGHAGKLVKVAAGVMNTHSRVADCRAETLAAHAALAGGTPEVVAALFDAPTTDAMVDVLRAAGILEQTMGSVMTRMRRVLARRAGESLRVEAVVFTQSHGVLGTTAPDVP